LKTDSDCLDWLSDGLLDGTITQLYGEYATGKSTYCLKAASVASSNGKRTIYIDTENGFSPERLMQIGGKDSLKDVMVFYPGDLEEQTRTIQQIEGSIKGDVGLIVVDSMVALYKVDAKDLETRTELINDLSLQLLVLSRIARHNNIPVVITNHVYEDIENKRTMAIGGHTLRYWSKVIIELSKGEGARRIARLIRHPYIPENRKCIFTLVNEGFTSNDKIFK